MSLATSIIFHLNGLHIKLVAANGWRFWFWKIQPFGQDCLRMKHTCLRSNMSSGSLVYKRENRLFKRLKLLGTVPFHNCLDKLDLSLSTRKSGTGAPCQDERSVCTVWQASAFRWWPSWRPCGFLILHPMPWKDKASRTAAEVEREKNKKSWAPCLIFPFAV